MGVKGLLGFAKSPYANACSTVTLHSEAQEYYRVFGRPPLLICDGNGLLRKLYSTSFPTVYGGQWIEYKNSVAEFVGKFRHLQIDLLFVFDGRVEEQKKHVWFNRRKEDHERNCKIFDSIRECGREPDRRSYFVMPATAQYSTALILKSLGVEVLSSITDADTAVAFYARERMAFGVLTNDSDMLIYKCACPIYTIGDLQMFDMKTLKISPKKLCHHLQLEQADMPLLACLVGNDRIPNTSLRSFHHNIHRRMQGMQHQESLILSVAQYISDCKRERKSLPHIAYQVFPDFNDNILKDFVHAVGQYVLPPDEIYWLTSMEPLGLGNWTGSPVLSPWRPAVLPPDFLEMVKEKSSTINEKVLMKVIDMHMSADIPPNILGIIIYQRYECSSSLEDYKQNELPAIGEVYRPIRQCVYGLLLGNKNCLYPAGHTVREWQGDKTHPNGVSDDRVSFDPLLAPGHTRLGELWLSPRDPRSSYTRMRVFLTCCLCQNLIPRMSHLTSVPPHLTVLCVLLHYLFYKIRDKPFLKSCEVDAFIAQEISPLRNDVKEIKEIRIMPRPRAVNLASIFVRGIAAVSLANAASGKPLPQGAFSPVFLFDGMLFMKKYMQTLHGINAQILCDRNPGAKDLFFHLKGLVLTGRT